MTKKIFKDPREPEDSPEAEAFSRALAQFGAAVGTWAATTVTLGVYAALFMVSGWAVYLTWPWGMVATFNTFLVVLAIRQTFARPPEPSE